MEFQLDMVVNYSKSSCLKNILRTKNVNINDTNNSLELKMAVNF